MNSVFHLHQKSREAMYNFCKNLSNTHLNAIPKGFNNNIIWNVGHMISVEQSLIYGLSKVPSAVPEEILLGFKPKTKPEGDLSQAQIDQVLSLLISTPSMTEQDYRNGKFIQVIPFIAKSMGATFTTIEDIITFNTFHEGIHTGIIQKYNQILKEETV